MHTLFNVATDVAGQPRTGHAKKFVVYKPERPDLVFKGPYDVGDNKFINTFMRSKIMSKWGNLNVAHPIGRYEFPNTVNNDGSPTNCVIFANLLHEMPTSSRNNTESWSGLTYRIRDPDPRLQKLSDYIKKTNDFTPLTFDVFKTYVYLFILKAGDMGLHNTLITNEKRVYVIDYEDNLGTDRDDSTFYFSKPSPAKYRVYETFKPYYFEFSKELDIIPLPPGDYGHRKDIAKALLIKYSQVSILPPTPPSIPYPTIPPIAHIDSLISPPIISGNNSIAPPPTNNVLDNLNRLIAGINTQPVVGAGGISITTNMVGSSVIPQGAGGIASAIGDPKKKGGVKGPGEMVYYGMKGANKTLHGYTPSLIKSALQKNVRRGFTDQGIMCAFEMWKFSVIDGYQLVHNMYNRLVIIACEDLSPYSLIVQSYVCNWVVNWVHGHTDFTQGLLSGDASSNNNPSGKQIEKYYDPARLAGMVYVLSKAPKSRVASHIFKSYTVPEGRTMLMNNGFTVESPTEQFYKQADYDYLNQRPHPLFKDTDFGIDNGKFCLTLAVIYNRLLAKDSNVVVWLDYFFTTYTGVYVSGRNKRLSAIVIWEMFAQFLDPAVLKPLQDAYFYVSEQRPVFMCVVCNIIMGERGDPYDVTAFEPYRNMYLQSSDLNKYINGDYTLVIEPYMRDKHTGVKGDPLTLHRQFVLEGAQVENQDPNTLNETLKKIYESLPPMEKTKPRKNVVH